MKVLFITPYIGSAYGGISKIVLELVAALSSSGLAVDLITTNADVGGRLEVPLGRWVQQGNYRIQYFSCWHKNDFIFSKGILRWLYKHVSDYSLVHTHTIFSPLVSCCHWICRSKKIPYIVTPHGMLEPWAIGYKSHKKRAYLKLVEMPNLLSSSFIQGTASVETKNICSFVPGLKVIFVPNGIETTVFQNGNRVKPLLFEKFPQLKEKRIVLFLGRIDPKKGLDLLAPAFEEAHRRFPDTHLVIAGSDNIGFQSTAEQYFINAGVENSITFTGMLVGDLKQSALEIAEIYVAPSYSEGFSMSVLEGMASGLPCVITTGCNFPEAAKANAAKVVDIQADAIAQALIEFLSDPLAAKVIGDRARQFVLDHYTWDRVAAQLIEVYTDILTVPSESPLA